MDLIQTERSMIEHADEVIILADSRKFERNGNLFLCHLDRVNTIITDAGIKKEHIQPIKDKGKTLLLFKLSK
jgi:DeoR family transcriptional regulator, ulaG and ulaABCDEF operon transcriptional repressor